MVGLSVGRRPQQGDGQSRKIDDTEQWCLSALYAKGAINRNHHHDPYSRGKAAIVKLRLGPIGFYEAI